MSLLSNLMGTRSRDTVVLRVSKWLSGWVIANISALLQIFGILNRRMQEVRKSQNQDLRADLEWSINFRKMEFNPRDFTGFKRLRAAANSSGLKFVQTGRRQEERPDLPVSLLMVLYALRLECGKSMELTASSHRSCFFCSSRDSRDEAALSESVPTGARMKEQ